MTVAILGGTGPQGQGLAMRFAAAGIPIILGSREKMRSEDIVSQLNPKLPKGSVFVEGATNEEAIRKASDLVVQGLSLNPPLMYLFLLEVEKLKLEIYQWKAKLTATGISEN